MHVLYQLTFSNKNVLKSSACFYRETSAVHAALVYAAVMPQNRYEALMQFMHFIDKPQVPLKN